MIGDSANDSRAARAAGCPVFCVPYGYRGTPRGARTGLRCYSADAFRRLGTDRHSAVMNFVKLENLRLEIRAGWRWWRPSASWRRI